MPVDEGIRGFGISNTPPFPVIKGRFDVVDHFCVDDETKQKNYCKDCPKVKKKGCRKSSGGVSEARQRRGGF